MKKKYKLKMCVLCKDLKTISKSRVVDSFKEASDSCKIYIAENDLGSSEWKAGEVTDRITGRIVAHISYNGTIWTPDLKTEITD